MERKVTAASQESTHHQPLLTDCDAAFCLADMHHKMVIHLEHAELSVRPLL